MEYVNMCTCIYFWSKRTFCFSLTGYQLDSDKMNNTTLEQPYNRTILTLTSLCGFVSFMENVVVFSFIVKLVKKFSSSTEQHEFIKQLLVLCMNDTLSSFILFWLGLLRVTGKESALICVFMSFIPIIFQ